MLNQISKGPQNLCFNKWGGLQSTLEVEKHLKCGLSMGAGVEVKTGESTRIKVRHTHPQCTLNRSYRQDSCVDRVMPGMENRGWRREMGAGGSVRVTPRVSSHKGNALAGCIPSRRSELPVPECGDPGGAPHPFSGAKGQGGDTPPLNPRDQKWRHTCQTLTRALQPSPRNWLASSTHLTFSLPLSPTPIPAHLHKVPINTFSHSYLDP